MDDIPIPHSFYPSPCLLSASLLTIQNAHTLPSPHSLVHLLKNRQAAAYDGFTEIAGGCFFDGNWRQLGVQVAEAVIGFVWSFVGSLVLYALVDCIPGIEVFATDEGIIAGMDASQMGESLYEAQWAGEEDYHPFHQDASIRLE